MKNLFEGAYFALKQKQVLRSLSYAKLKNKKLSTRWLRMRKTEPVRYSFAVGEAWLHAMFKVKYCHKIFDDEFYREGMRTLLLEAAYEYGIELGVIGF